MAVLNMTHRLEPLELSICFRSIFQGCLSRSMFCGSQGGHLWASWKRESTPRASASGSDHSWHSSPASSQVGAGQWSGANGHLPSLSIELIVLSRGTGATWLNEIEIAYQTSKLIPKSAATCSLREPPTVSKGTIISGR